MKVIIISIIIAIIAVTNCDASILDLLFKKNNQIKIVDLKQDNAKPLTWLSDNSIVISKEGAIYLYDIKRETLLERVVDSYDESNFQGKNCFTPDASVFELNAPIIKYKNGKIYGKSAPAQQSYRNIVDWHQPSKNKYVDNTKSWGINKLDCTIFDKKDRTEYINRQKIENGYFSMTHSSPLLKSIHGESFLFVKKRSNNKYPKHIELGRKLDNAQDTGNSTYRQLQLELDSNGMPHGNEIYMYEIASFYDSHEDNYVIYEKTNIFDSKRGMWPLSAWRVTPKLKPIERYTLPPGPWVKKHSFLKKLSYFDAGCETYSHMKLYGGGGKIYAHVWGKAIDSDEAGVYRLEGTGSKTRWANLILDNFKNEIIVSPDGCVIVFSDQNNKLKKMEICSFSK